MINFLLLFFQGILVKHFNFYFVFISLLRGMRHDMDPAKPSKMSIMMLILPYAIVTPVKIMKMLPLVPSE